MHQESLRILAKRPLRFPEFTKTLLSGLQISACFRPEDILYISLTTTKARKGYYDILSLYQNQVLRPPKANTLKIFARNLLKEHSFKGVVNQEDRRYILLNLIHHRKTSLFKEEHLGLLSRLYSDLKRHYPSNWNSIPSMAQELVFDPDIINRLKDALFILEKYELYLKEENLVDDESILEAASEYLDKLPYKLLIIEGYFEPWTAERKMFSKLLNSIPNAVVIIPNHPLSSSSEAFFTKHNLEQKLFTAQEAAQSTWRKYPSREDEVINIAREICRMQSCGEIKYPGEVMLVFPELALYRPIVERVFKRYGLKADFTENLKLSKHPGVQIVIDLLRVVEKNFRRRELVGLLISPIFKNVPASVRNWLDSLSRDENITGGRDAWRNKFLKTYPRRFYKLPAGKKLWKEIAKFVYTFIEDIEQLHLCSSVEEFLKKLKRLLYRLEWDPGNEVIEAFDEVLEKLKRMSEFAGETSLSLKFIRETLEVLAGGRQLEKKEQNDEILQGIKVSSLVKSRWLNPMYLFFGGLVDGEFPQHPRRDLLVPESLRRKLGFITVENHFKNDEFEFFRLLEMPVKKVYLSSPSMDADKPLLPSVFLSERDEDVAGGESNTVVYCEEEYQTHIPISRPPREEGVVINNPVSIELIKNKFSETYPFRVTSLETYRACPYRYYLRSVLGIEAYEEASAEPEGRLLGNIVHDIMEKLFKGIDSFQSIEDKLRETITNELNARDLNPFIRAWIEDWLNARIDWFLAEEEVRENKGWEIDPAWIERKLEYFFSSEGFTLKGRVDRVDWMQNRAKVFDYKTGKESKFRLKLKKGLSIQLPLYCEMIKRMYGAKIDSFGLYNWLDLKLNMIHTDESGHAVNQALEFAIQAIEGIRSGRFEASENQICWYCEYKQLCGIAR